MSDIREICSSSKIAIHDVPARHVDIESINEIKRETIEELLALHEKDREKVSSQCNTLINMSTVMKYLEGAGVTKVNPSELGVMTAKFQYIVNGISVVNSFDYLRESYGSLDNLSARKRSDVSKEFILHKYEISKAIARM